MNVVILFTDKERYLWPSNLSQKLVLNRTANSSWSVSAAVDQAGVWELSQTDNGWGLIRGRAYQLFVAIQDDTNVDDTVLPSQRPWAHNEPPHFVSVAIHSSSDATVKSKVREWVFASYGDGVRAVCEYSHLDSDRIWSAFSDLIAGEFAVRSAQTGSGAEVTVNIGPTDPGRLTEVDTVIQKCEAAILGRSLFTKIANLRHAVRALLLPMELDLRGLQETKFARAYVLEVTASYMSETAVGRLAEALRLIRSCLAARG